MKKQFLFFIIIPLVFIGCKNRPDMKDIYSLTNNNGLKATITAYGARLVSLNVPDKQDKMTSVVLGFDSVDQYKKSTNYYGAIIGRYGNRIANGKFSLNGKEYHLFLNNGPNSLHGGLHGFDSKEWTASQLNDQKIELTYLSKNGEEGYPGNLHITVTYELTDSNELKISYEAITDSATVINLTNHAFFNLNGEGSGSILNHSLQINADEYTPVDSTLIPTGKLESVKTTPFDFSSAKTIGQNINDSSLQLKNGHGYDHNFILKGEGLKLGATATGDQSGITMEVWTDQPGLQFYSGNFMDGKNQLRKGPDDFRTAFCLETQHYPNSPNEPDFPTTVLRPGQTFRSVSIYKFRVLK
jgi:aldose 1-epimerase